MSVPTADKGKQSARGTTALVSDISSSGLKIRVVSANCIYKVEREWRKLEQGGVQSPGQNFDFIDLWIKTFDIAPQDQCFSVVFLDQKPVILMALQSRTMFGIKVLSPFPGKHVSCGAPLVDTELMQGLGKTERAALWRAAVKPFKGMALVQFPYVPDISGKDSIFAQMGMSVPADKLYRSEFESWEQCDQQQRSRSRRKHDKQHTRKLAVLGEVSFEQTDAGGEEGRKNIKTMFEQRARRFAVQGITNPFASPSTQKFYAEVAAASGALKGVLHVLRLDNEIVALRYNLVFRERMFCLVTSISEDVNIQFGSPGKQCLLRVMQTIFDDGIRSYDVGVGASDEKRHWCNIQIPLRHYYIPMNFTGCVLASVQKWIKSARYRLKNSSAFAALLKKFRSNLSKIRRGLWKGLFGADSSGT